MLPEEGKVYSFGRGKRGQTGQGLTEEAHAPAEIPSLGGMRISKIAGGEDFTIVVSGMHACAHHTEGLHLPLALSYVHDYRGTESYLFIW